MTRRRGRPRRRRAAGGRAAAWSVAALLALVVAVPLLFVSCDLVDPARREMRETLRAQLGGEKGRRRWFRRSPEKALVGNYAVAPLVRRFYERRGFQAAWCSTRGPTDDARALAAALGDARAQGMDPDDAQAGAVRARLEALTPEGGPFAARPEPRALAELDLLLTRSFFKHGMHLHSGQLDPVRLPADWHVSPRQADLVPVLEHALRAHEVRRALADLAPQHEGYVALLALLGRYRALERSGGWPVLSPGPALRRGSRDGRVARLRARLAATGDLAAPGEAPARFDATLERAVRRFQERHGLAPSGVVGERELAELNVPVTARIRQIQLNLERWRWLPADLGARHVLVNIPAFSLEAREGGRSVLDMRVVVGRQLSRTPMFSDTLTYVVFNPVWEVPPDIATNETLAAIQKDPKYLAKNHLRVFRGRGREARPVDPASVDWRKVTPETFRFSLKQDPGPENAVGHVKFMCPNQYAVYLHDTPAGRLFEETDRDYSHGCVRVERPLELAQYLLRGKKGWDEKRVAAAFDTLRNQAVILPERVPVHLLYWTAWVDGRGRAQFRRDVYGLDSLLAAALARGRSQPAAAVEWARLPRDSSGAKPAGRGPRGGSPAGGRSGRWGRSGPFL